MAATDTVTIQQAYFQTLLRKAKVHGGEPNADPSVVAVPKPHLDYLEKSVREYHALRSTLRLGGVTADNLQLLINTGLAAEEYQNGIGPSDIHGIVQQQACAVDDETATSHLAAESSAVLVEKPELPSPVGFTDSLDGSATMTSRPTYANGSHRQQHHHRRKSRETVVQGGFEQDDMQRASGGNRTLFFSRLSESTSYASLLEVVRGGAVVDAWMKLGERCASVSFVEPAAADAFYRYAKKHDIYINGRRVQVQWREPARQFVILPNILRQIYCNGASRNLNLRNIPPTLTEARLRADLDHISNLDVEKITFDRAAHSVQVNLNSVCAACFARTCLRSRAYYKGCRIEFGPDECAASLPDSSKSFAKQAPQKLVADRKVANRFDALALDESESEEDEGDTSGFEGESWADSTYTESMTNGA